MLAGTLLFSVLNALVKQLGDSYPTWEVIFFRSLTALPVLWVMIRFSKQLDRPKTSQPKRALICCLAAIGSMYFIFRSFHLMPLADALTLIFAAPLFVSLLAVPILRESLGPIRLAACLIGLAGVAYIMKPGSDLFGEGAVYALLAAVLMAIALVLIRDLSKQDHPLSISFFFTLGGTFAGLVGCLVSGWVWPNMEDLLILCLLGLFGAWAVYALSRAYQMAEASIIAPLDYVQILWGALLGYLFWQEVPGTDLWIGGAMIIASGLLIIWRESRRQV